MPRYEADEDVLYQNNIVVIYTYLSPIFHNKAILSFIYSLVSEHPHPSLRATFSCLEKACLSVAFDGGDGFFSFIGILIHRKRSPFSCLEKAYWFVAFDGGDGVFSFIGILIRRFAPPSPTWRRLIGSSLSTVRMWFML